MPLFSQHTPSSSHPGATAHGAGGATLLKRYRPLETRATGGFGSVEICLDARLQRRVAIKRMPLATRTSTEPPRRARPHLPRRAPRACCSTLTSSP